MTQSLDELLTKAAAAFKRMTPEERAEMLCKQRQSFLRAEAAFGSDEDEAKYRAALRSGDTETLARLDKEADARVELVNRDD